VKRLLGAVLLGLVALPPPAAEGQAVGPAFRRVNPSVVIIRAGGKEAAGAGQVTRVAEIGSGVLITADGKVITAAHVVQTADEITVEFLEGELVAARVIASEPEADVSLLQLERVPTKATVATLGNSDRAQVGDQVFIIGAPYGIAHTLSVGYITGRHKPNTVYNMAGEVIGVASHNISKSGGSEGLGFVVTINMARRLLLERRSFWSGMSGVAITRRVARALNLPQPVAVLVQQVAADSPAARIGLRPGVIPASVEGKSLLLGGDIILAVQGHRIGTETYEALQERMSRLPPGSPISVTVLRDGREVTLTAVKD